MNKKRTNAQNTIVILTVFFLASASYINAKVITQSRGITNNSGNYEAAAFSYRVTSPKTSPVKAGDVNSVNDLNKSLLSLYGASDFQAASSATSSQREKSNRAKFLSRDRKTQVLRLMKDKPNLFGLVAFKKEDRDRLPSNIKDDIEEEAQIEGRIRVIHTDDFDNPQNSRFDYYLKTNSTEYKLYPGKNISVESDALVRVKGYKLADTFSVPDSQGGIEVTSDPAPAPSSVGNQRTLVILMSPTASTPQPFTPAQAQDLIFNGQFQNFMKEQSYGKVSFSGDVIGWVITPEALKSCSMLPETDLGNIVRDYNVDLSGYDRLLVVVPQSLGGCSSIGKYGHVVNGVVYQLSEARIGAYGYNGTSAWGKQDFPWTNLDYELSHELGHSLGAAHANGWDCGSQPISGDCSHVEYGNPFDAMGRFGNSLHFNAFYKDLLGWVSPQEEVLADKSGEYVVGPLEFRDGPVLVKVQQPGGTDTPYYIELRKGLGFDSNLNKTGLDQNQYGLMVNKVITPTEGGAAFTRLIDLFPSSDSWGVDTANVALGKSSTTSVKYTYNNNSLAFNVDGKSLLDPGRGITIGPVYTVSSSTVGFGVRLGVPSCVRYAPHIFNLVDSAFDHPDLPQIINPGDRGFIVIPFENKDYFGCGASDFISTLVAPPGWEFVITPTEARKNLNPEERTTVSSYINVPADAAPGVYNLEYQLKEDAGKPATLPFVVSVADTLSVISVTPGSGGTGSLITITGTGFDTVNRNTIKLSRTDPDSGASLEGSIATSSPDGSRLSFMVPARVLQCRPQVCTMAPTPQGVYSLTVTAASKVSNQVNFEVMP